MNPVHLRTFLAVQKHRNYTRAAEELFLSQPAVSRQIRQLEQGLGVRLFEQIGKSVNLTDAGRTLVDEAGKLLGQMERVSEAVQSHRSDERGLLRIGASTTPGYYLLPPILGRFRRTHPDVELQFSVENSLVIERRVLHNELDLGFIGVHSTSDGIRIESIADDEIVCFGSADHPLAGRKRIAPGALDDQTWIVRERGSATRQIFEEWWTSTGGVLRRTIELHSPEAIKALVRAGVGISFMSIHGIDNDLRQGCLTRINLAGLRLERPIYFIRHLDKHISPVIQGFFDLLNRHAGRRDGDR